MVLTLQEIEDRLEEISKQIGRLSQLVEEAESDSRIEIVKANLENRIRAIAIEVGKLTASINTDDLSRIDIVKAGIDNRLDVIVKQIGQLAQSVNSNTDVLDALYDAIHEDSVEAARSINDGTYSATAKEISQTVDAVQDGVSVVGDLLDLSDTPDTYSGEAGKIVQVKDDESGVEFVDNEGGGGTASDFLDLTDSPESYSGKTDQVVVVNGTEDGLTFRDDCPKYIVLSASAQSEGDIHLSGANWGTSKALIKSIVVETSSTDWDMYLLYNDNGYSADDASIGKLQIMGSGNGDEDIFIDESY